MRVVVRTLLGLLAVLAVLWLGLWWWAEARMQDGMQNWLARFQPQSGVKISYDSISRGVSPLAASLTVSGLHYTVQPQDGSIGPFSMTFPSFVLRADIWDPLDLRFIFPSQVNIDTPRADVTVTFGSCEETGRIDLNALLKHEIDPFTSLTLAASDINVLASSGSLAILHIDSIDGLAKLNRQAGAGETAFSDEMTISNIALSPLVTRLAAIPFGGAISEFSAGFSLTGPIPADWQQFYARYNKVPVTDQPGHARLILQALHEWALRGGSADGSVKLVIGPSTLTAAGTAKFDSNAQPSGTASLTADHLDEFAGAIASAYPATQNAINNIQARLSPYLTSSQAGGQTLGLQVTYGKGSVTVNGQTSPLPPLDWSKLENTPLPAS